MSMCYLLNGCEDIMNIMLLVTIPISSNLNEKAVEVTEWFIWHSSVCGLIFFYLIHGWIIALVGL